MRLRPGVAIDLGTVNTLVSVAGQGLVVEEPSAVALDRATGSVADVGKLADALAGKEPVDVEVIYPLRDGVIADLEASTAMLHAFLRRARVRRWLLRPHAVVCVPAGATWVERRSIPAAVAARSPHCAVTLGVDAALREPRVEYVPGPLVAEALEHTVAAIATAVKQMLTDIPPDLAEDVVRGKIRLAGGGALLLGLASRIEASAGIPTVLVDDPLRCVVRGAAEILEHGGGIVASGLPG